MNFRSHSDEPLKNHPEDQARKTSTKHYGYDIPLPSQHPDKCDGADSDGEPIDHAITGKDHVQGKPDRQIEHYAHHRCALLLGLLSAVFSMGQEVGPLRLEKEIALPGVEGRIDHFSVDVPGQRLFIAALENGSVEILDTRLGIIVVDRKKRAAVAKWGIGGLFANYPMAMDEANKRLFVGCRLPARLVVLDATSGRLVTSLPTVGDTDDIFYDPGRHLVFVIGGEGAVEILRQHDPDHYEPVHRITTAPGARTGLFVPAFNRLFVAVPHRGLQPARVLVYEVKGD
jgi:hypothetical protein